MSTKAAAYKGYRIILLSSFLYSTFGVWSHLMGADFDPFYQAWVRSLIIVLIMLPFMVATKSFRRIKRADWPHMAVYLGLCICTQVPLYYAFTHAPIGTVQLIFNAMLLIAAYGFGWGYLGEYLTQWKLASIVLALCGLAIVFGVSALTVAPLGLLMAAFNGAAAGGEVSATKKFAGKYPPALLVFWGWACTVLTHLPLSLLLGEKQVMPTMDSAWLWLVIYSAVNALALWTAVVGYRYVDASIGGLVSLTVIVFTIALGVILFKEPLHSSTIIGATLIVISSIVPNITERRKENLELS